MYYEASTFKSRDSLSRHVSIYMICYFYPNKNQRPKTFTKDQRHVSIYMICYFYPVSGSVPPPTPFGGRDRGTIGWLIQVQQVVQPGVQPGVQRGVQREVHRVVQTTRITTRRQRKKNCRKFFGFTIISAHSPLSWLTPLNNYCLITRLSSHH